MSFPDDEAELFRVVTNEGGTFAVMLKDQWYPCITHKRSLAKEMLADARTACAAAGLATEVKLWVYRYDRDATTEEL